MALSKEEAEKYLEKPKSKDDGDEGYEPKKGEMVSVHRLRLLTKLLGHDYGPERMSDAEKLKCFDELVATKE